MVQMHVLIRADESTDTTVELVDKTTGNVVETKKHSYSYRVVFKKFYHNSV